MKSFVVTALIVLATVFCISHVDGSRASEVKSIEKRQVPLLPVRNQTCTFTELQRRNDSLRCSNASVGQQLLDVFAECGHNNEALRKEQECGRSARGGFCYELKYDTAVTGLVDSVVSNCEFSCDPSCNSSLQQLTDSTGCCANYLITNAYIQSGQQPISTPWSTCNFRSPSNCLSTLRFVRNQDETVCPQSDIAYHINRLFCNPNYITPFITIMRSCGRTHEESAQSMINGCGVNKYERFCFETETSQLVSDVQGRCFVNATTCPILCKIALDMYRTGADCCLNNLYNNTLSYNTLSSTSASNLRTTNHVLWSFCEMSSPGFCRNTIDSSSAYSVLLQVSVAVTGLSAIIAMVVWLDTVALVINLIWHRNYVRLSYITMLHLICFAHVWQLHAIVFFQCF